MTWAFGIDTSNYTTSVACFDGTEGVNVSKLLTVPQGTLGLRQSDALFQHVKRLPEMVEGLMAKARLDRVAAIGASTRPREVEGSYMPCFLAGESQGRVVAQVMGRPFYACSHQQGHLAAAAWSAGAMDLLDRPHLAWHLSGGTTELLYIRPDGAFIQAEQIGGTSDISAGQLIDRTGKALGLDFPAGKAVDSLALRAKEEGFFPVKVRQRAFSLSGIENQMRARREAGEKPETICRFVLGSVIHAVQQATDQALAQYPGLPVLYAGGVASSRLLRDTVTKTRNALFAQAAYSTDNAMGVAILAWRQFIKEQEHG